MKFKLKRKAPLPESERQMLLAFVISLYTDAEQPARKPPAPAGPAKLLEIKTRTA